MPRTRSLAWSELKIGVLTIAAIGITAITIFMLMGTKGFFWQRYTLKTKFTNVAGLKSGSPVRIAGVEVGSVDDVEVVGQEVDVIFQINSDKASLVTSESVATLTEQLVPPARAAYTAMSYGKLSLALDAATRWFRVPQPSTYYGLNAADGPAHKDQYIADAIAAADADVDFSRYQIVYLVASAGASADMTTETDRLPGQPLAIADGTEMRHAVFIGNARLHEARHGSDGIIHETGHVLGLPDLYGDPTSVGGWDPMSFNIQPGAELMGWHRWKLSWLEPAQIRWRRRPGLRAIEKLPVVARPR